MQSPAGSIHSPRPQGRGSSQPQVSFDKELMASLHVLLNQLGEVERQGLVMFHKIEESFKHPYAQQEAIADTANLLLQLDTLSSQAKTTGFGALTLPSASPTVTTPSGASSNTTNAGAASAGTPKAMFLSPRMQSHLQLNNIHHQNQNNNPQNTTTAPTATAVSATADITMLSPGPNLGPVTPSNSNFTGVLSGSTPLPGSVPMDPVSMSTASTPVPTAATSTIATSAIGGLASLPASVSSPYNPLAGSTDVTMSMSTPSASGMDPTSSGLTLAQMMDARQKDVQVLYAEKAKLKNLLRVASTLIKPEK